MRIRILLQIGAMHKPDDNPDADFIQLWKGPEEILKWAVDNSNMEFKHIKTHKMALGEPFLMEFESITDLPTC